nr:uncharacterized protein LOC112210799 [Halyomorpha halys]
MLLLSGSQGWGVQRNQSGVRIGQRQTSYLGGNNVRGSGVKIGVKDKGFTRVVTTTPPPPPTLPPPPDPAIKKMVKVGLLVPKRQFGSRDYQKSVNTALMSIQRATRGRQLSSFKSFDFQHITVMNPYTPSPTASQKEHANED